MHLGGRVLSGGAARPVKEGRRKLPVDRVVVDGLRLRVEARLGSILLISFGRNLHTRPIYN
jgi:hypothetical protein